MDIKSEITSKMLTAFAVTVTFGYFGGKFLYNYFKEKSSEWLRDASNPVKLSKLDQAYNLLGCSEKSSEAEIKNAYKKLAKLYHPDSTKNPDEANARFLKLKAAYDMVLLDKKKGQKE